MKSKYLPNLNFWLLAAVAWLGSNIQFAASHQSVADDDFRQVLELAEIGPEKLSAMELDSRCGIDDWNAEQWEIAAQLLARLRQTSPAQQERWVVPASRESLTASDESRLGTFVKVTGTVTDVTRHPLPNNVQARTESPAIYLSRLENADLPFPVIVISPSIPARWDLDNFAEQPVSLRGVVLPSCDANGKSQAVLISERMQWFPSEGVPPGQILLAAQGMDAALWDEVVHRAPFVDVDVSRESTAFYSALAAVGSVPADQLRESAQATIAGQQEHWQSRLGDLDGAVRELRAELRSAEEQQPVVQQQLEATTRQLALARTVIEQADRGESSVALLFLEPENHVGELVAIEGIARRAVKIAAGSAPLASDALPKVTDYYEIEIFTRDSQNLPVVCCVTRLPVGFPTGDAIREPVRVTGVFFKNWRYRTRQLVEGPGETSRQQPLYTPIVLAESPVWLQTLPAAPGWGGPVAGVVFLVVLVGLWMLLAQGSRKRRTAYGESPPDFRDV